MAAENGEFRREVNDINGKKLKAVLSAKQLQAIVSSMTEERDPQPGKFKEFALVVQ